jgi:hypothetical protein
MIAQAEDDAILCAQFQKFKSLSVHELGLDKTFQFSSTDPFSSPIQLLKASTLFPAAFLARFHPLLFFTDDPSYPLSSSWYPDALAFRVLCH